MATGYLIRTGFANGEPGHSIRLNPEGLDALDGYRVRTSVDAYPGLRSVVDGVLQEREALASGFEPPEGCWRGEKPYLAQTKRLLAEPTKALPWHPMVLHRGGWPDAS